MKNWTEKSWGILIALIIAISIIGFSSCGVSKQTKTTHNCELMQNGQKCLPDHSCCK